MPCDRLAVQTAQVTINENLLALVVADEKACNAIASILTQATGLTFKTYEASGQWYCTSGSGITVTLYKNGRVKVESRYKNQGDEIKAAFMSALAQVAMIVLQNLIAANLTQNGVQVVDDQWTPVGNRVMTLDL